MTCWKIVFILVIKKNRFACIEVTACGQYHWQLFCLRNTKMRQSLTLGGFFNYSQLYFVPKIINTEQMSNKKYYTSEFSKFC